jgi:hypothetical protein
MQKPQSKQSTAQSIAEFSFAKETLCDSAQNSVYSAVLCTKYFRER